MELLNHLVFKAGIGYNSASLTQTLKATTNPIVIASALVPVSSSYAVTDSAWIQFIFYSFHVD